ncbi:hypothetical protein Q2430_27260, partial [Escherichia coli]|nr:hypothetical protein [Escherichia coli]
MNMADFLKIKSRPKLLIFFYFFFELKKEKVSSYGKKKILFIMTISHYFPYTLEKNLFQNSLNGLGE